VVRLALVPLSLPYVAIVRVRATAYRRGVLRAKRLILPTVAVGNLSVGGTGKTPLAAWIARRYVGQGRTPGILLRGYGGDEPLVHRRLVPEGVVVAHPDRVAGAVRARAAGADILVLDDLKSFRPREVLKRGAAPRFTKLEAPEWVRQTVSVAPVDAGSFRVPAGPRKIRVMRVIPAQLLTGVEAVEPAVRDGAVVADASRDLVKIAVVERHHASGRVGIGFATNVGLKRGAFASTVAHDAHNIVVLGVDDADMAACTMRLAEIGGGIVVAEGGRVVEELPLPIAGLMSDRPLAEVHERLRSMEARLKAMGVGMASPFMTLSFLALSVIPELKITDRGLVDVNRFELVPLGIE